MEVAMGQATGQATYFVTGQDVGSAASSVTAQDNRSKPGVASISFAKVVLHNFAKVVLHNFDFERAVAPSAFGVTLSIGEVLEQP